MYSTQSYFVNYQQEEFEDIRGVIRIRKSKKDFGKIGDLDSLHK